MNSRGRSVLVAAACLLGGSSMAFAQSYRTLSEIAQILQDAADDYPSICAYHEVGTSVQGRKLYAVNISDNVGVEEDEPEFKYVSTMHGDEWVGNEMVLHLIDEMLTNYGSDPQITNLVNNADIWLMPVMNPDGFVVPQRYNANGHDLNRRFPDPFASPDNTPAGRPVEVGVIMNWTWAHSFTLSANLHGGALLVNYPYDNNPSGSSVYTASPDDDLFVYISEQYSQHNLPMWNSGSFYHGITNGADWYAIDGGMQDWHYRYVGCNEVTIELSNTKIPSASQIPTFWSQNRDSMLAYMDTCFIGVRGIVTDGATGNPLAATVTVAGRNHEIYTDPDVGDYHRMLLPGTYDLTFSAPSYDSKTVENVVVTAGDATRVDVFLGDGPPIAESQVVEVIGSETITLLGFDPNGDPVDFIVTSLPGHGTLTDPNAGVITSVPYTLANGGSQVLYTVEPPDFIGNDSFLFKLTDYNTPPVGGESNTAGVSILVRAPAPEITTTTLPDATVGAPYGPLPLQVNGGQLPLTWTLITDVNYLETDLGTNAFEPASGVAMDWYGDDTAHSYTLPFAFPFYGENHTQIRGHTNGFIDLWPLPSNFVGSNYSNSDSGLINNKLIAPLWDDLLVYPGSSAIYVDESTPGQVTVRWDAVVRGAGALANFAVTLFSDGTIEFHYGAGNAPVTATVGISNGDGINYVLSSHNPATTLTHANSVRIRQVGILPFGMQLSAAGELLGTPTEAGEFYPTVKVTDSLGRTDETTLHLVVQEATTATGDYNLDGRVDLADFAAFQVCFGAGATGLCGDAFEFVPDGTIDLNDFAALAAAMNGPAD